MEYRFNENRFIENPTFSSTPMNHSKLSDHVIIYYTGVKWKIIYIKDLLIYPVIFDKYIEKDTVSDISVTFCPFSFSGVIYFGKYVPAGYTVDNNIVLVSQNDPMYKFSQLTGKPIDDKYTKSIRRVEMIVMKLQTALINYPDCLYFHNDKKDDKLINKLIIPDEVKSIKSKTLVYGLTSTMTRNVMVLVTGKSTEESFDLIESGYKKYLNENMDDIRDMGYFIVPCYWYQWISHYPGSKIMYV
jgi:hypothetical protein